MLGISYGTMQFVLPTWRIEGANNPFQVRLFPGWITYVAYPYYAIAGISLLVIFFFLSALFQQLVIPTLWGGIPAWVIIIYVTILWALFLACVYQQALLDMHERPLLLFTQNMARSMRLKLVSNFEDVIYRAILARYELLRLKVDVSNLKKILVFIEDRTFFTHHGVSARASLRALSGLLKLKRRSGGSTITQQLVRTLFVQEPTKLVRRKIIEIFLALWLDRVFTKNEQLELYIASVRFERGVYGVIEAMKKFWGGIISKTTMAQAFFLIERVSNIYSQLLSEKIIQMANTAMKSGLMTIDDMHELYKLYYDAVDAGMIKDGNGGLGRMAAAFGTAQQGNPANA
jgi:penicillin-binding protein 1A